MNPKEEWESDAEFSILDGNQYYADGPTYKIKNDIADIFLLGDIPNFNNDADKFTCAVEVGKFVSNNGFCGNESNVALLFQSFEAYHIAVCIREWPEEQVEIATRHNDLAAFIIKERE